MGSQPSTCNTTETNSDSLHQSLWDDSSLSDDSVMDVDSEALTFQSTEAFQEWLGNHLVSGLYPSGKILDIKRQFKVSTDDADGAIFKIHHKVSKKSFMFRASCTEQRDEWISVLEQHAESESEGTHQYTIRVMDAAEDESKLVIVHNATKHSWSGILCNEAQREYFQTPSPKWQLKQEGPWPLDTVTVTVDDPDVDDMVLTMDQLTSPRSTSGIDGDDDDADDSKDPAQPEVDVKVELTEQEKKNMATFTEYTFSLRPIAASDDAANALRIEMTHIALGLDFEVTLDSKWPYKPPPAPHDEDEVVEEIDGSAVNQLFGTMDSSDDDEEDGGEEVVSDVTTSPPPPPPTTMEILSERKESNAMEVLMVGSGKTAHIQLRFELNGEELNVELAQTAESIERLVMEENAASYALYRMVMAFDPETISLLIDIKHLEHGRDFEVVLGEEWLKGHHPEKYATPPPAAGDGDGDDDHDPDPKAVNALFENVGSSDDEEDDGEEVGAESKVEDVVIEEEVRGKELGDLMKCIEHCKNTKLLQMAMKGVDKAAAIELRFEMDGKEQLIEVKRSRECVQKQIEMEQKEENAATYPLYKMATEYCPKDMSLRVDIREVASGRDFEVVLGEEWLKMHFAEKYSRPQPVVEEEVHHEPVVDANALFENDSSSDDDDDDDEVEVEVIEEMEIVEEIEGKELMDLRECMEHNKSINMLAMTMKGHDKTASIELRFKMDGHQQLLEVPRSRECIQKQVEMEQKEEMELDAQYVAGIKAVAETGYGAYCAIEGLIDRHTFKQHRDDAADPQSANSRKIMRELRKTLAKGVYLSYSNGSMFVRFDESNPRFLQAMLVGLKGTPYFNGCFLFDIYLGDEYPQKPCKVKHVTNGAQLCHANNGPGGFSPNLHQSSGKVCLSLLGTWSGPGWDAGKSNVYQLLSTLLLMVFGAEHPFYMEPSYGGWEGTAYNKTEHEPRVIQYDEEVLYHTAKSTILEMMRTPYTGFEDIIRAHFRLKAKQIRQHMAEVLHCETYSQQFRKRVGPIYEQIEEELKKLE